MGIYLADDYYNNLDKIIKAVESVYDHADDDVKQIFELKYLHPKPGVETWEEFGELCEALAKGNRDMLKDGLGDMYVVMTILAMQQKVDVRDCIDMAYNEIKDRKGELVDGTFVKEEDLVKE